MTTLHCPICKKSFDSQASQSVPFCSDRCRQIDLGRWLKEGYSVPVARQPDEENGDASYPPESEPVD